MATSPWVEYLERHINWTATPLTEIRSGVPKRLAELVTHCLTKDPVKRPTLDELGYGLRRIASRRGLYPKVSTADPPNPDHLVMAAQGMSTLGYPDDAIEMAREVLIADPEPELEIFAHLIIARGFNDREDWDRATQELDVIERLLDVNDTPVQRTIYLSERGRVESLRGNSERAVRFFLAASELTPSDVVWYNLAIQYERLGQQDSKIDALQKAVNISKDIRYLRPLVGALLHEGRFSEAVEYGELGVRFHPGDSYAHAIRALALGFFVQANRDQSTPLLPKLRDDIEIAFRGKSSGYPPAEMLLDLEGIHGFLLSNWVPFGPGASPPA